MENTLRARLDKVREAHGLTQNTAPSVINITLAALESIRAHIDENYPGRYHEQDVLDEAIEVVKDYR